MNAIVPGANVKVIAKALQALHKIGDELYIEAKRNKLSFITLNLSKTVCARVDFYDSFFSSYEVDENELSSENKETITSKLHMKGLLPLFRGNLEKKLEFFKLDYDTASDIIVLKMKYKCDDILMVHRLRLLDTETLSIGVSADAGCNNICVSSSFYTQLLTMFCASDDEMTLEVSPRKVTARNYCIGVPYKAKTIRTQVNLNAAEFSTYNIQTETTINFSLKPFRTAVHFAEIFNLNLGFNFDTGGAPLSMIMKNPTFEANFIVATINPNSDMQSTMTTTSIPSKVIVRQHKSANDKSNITVEDQQALENENWDDFNIEMEEHSRNANQTTEAVKNSNSVELSASPNSVQINLTHEQNNGVEGVHQNNAADSKNCGGASGDFFSSGGSNEFAMLMNQALDNLEGKIKLGEAAKSSTDVAKLNLSGRNNEAASRQLRFNLGDNCDSENTETVSINGDEEDIVPRSPESPRTKKAKFVFGRCYDATFDITLLGEVVAENSDSE